LYAERQLTYEMWRAVRLVVDTGIHSMGWTRQQAIDYFRENTGKADHDTTVDADRYIVWPGQALAYKIGQMKFRELPTRAEKAGLMCARFMMWCWNRAGPAGHSGGARGCVAPREDHGSSRVKTVGCECF
jgi:hypothetical protein